MCIRRLQGTAALIFAFEFISAAYCVYLCYDIKLLITNSASLVHTGQGRTDLASMEFRIAGGFAFVTALVRIELHSFGIRK